MSDRVRCPPGHLCTPLDKQPGDSSQLKRSSADEQGLFPVWTVSRGDRWTRARSCARGWAVAATFVTIG